MCHKHRYKHTHIHHVASTIYLLKYTLSSFHHTPTHTHPHVLLPQICTQTCALWPICPRTLLSRPSTKHTGTGTGTHTYTFQHTHINRALPATHAPIPYSQQPFPLPLQPYPAFQPSILHTHTQALTHAYTCTHTMYAHNVHTQIHVNTHIQLRSYDPPSDHLLLQTSQPLHRIHYLHPLIGFANHTHCPSQPYTLLQSETHMLPTLHSPCLLHHLVPWSLKL
jgi:hypothetical protein